MRGQLIASTLIGLAVLGLGFGLSHEGHTDDGEARGAEDAHGIGMRHGMQGMHMDSGMMQPGDAAMEGAMPMMQMMMHCMRMMEQMHDHEGYAHGQGMNGAHGPGMMTQPAGEAVGASAAEAIARAFVAGREGADATAVEVTSVTMDDGDYLVECRHGDRRGSVAVDAATGEVRSTDGGSGP